MFDEVVSLGFDRSYPSFTPRPASTALGFPVGMSAAADDPAPAVARVSVVASIGYAAFLAGPPVIGLLGNYIGVRYALTAAVGVLPLGLLVSSACRPWQGTNRIPSAARPEPLVSRGTLP